MRKTCLLLAALLAFSFRTSAQRPGFALGLISSVDVYRYEALFERFYGPSYASDLDIQFRPCASLGGQVHYTTASNLTVTMGFILSNKSITYGPKTWSYATTSPIKAIRRKEFYLDVPLKLGYSFRLTDRVALTPTTGLVSSFYLGDASITKYADGRTDRRRVSFDRAFTSTLFSIPAELHADVVLTPRLQLSAGPYYRFGPNSPNADYTHYVSSYGLTGELRYLLSKAE